MSPVRKKVEHSNEAAAFTFSCGLRFQSWKYIIDLNKILLFKKKLILQL